MHSQKSSPFVPFTWNIRGSLHRFDSPVLMGIINATPDSFFAGSRSLQVSQALEKARQMLEEGAQILDLGGYSTRPGAADISPEEEIGRVVPILESLSREFPQAFLSIDTFRASVARAAVEAGAHIVNDIGAGLLDKQLLPVVAALRVPYIYMHMQGTPATMQLDPQYPNVSAEVLDFLASRQAEIRKHGIADSAADPGFGFGKTLAHNFQLLREMEVLQLLKSPVLAGISRKSMISRTLGVPAAESLNGTTALHMLALEKGASILRVHDVKPAAEAITLWKAYRAIV